MNFQELVTRRYSCRNYSDRPIEREKLDYVMECVRLAPSAVNLQPWRFRVIENAEQRQQLCQCYKREWLQTAPVIIMATLRHDEEWVRRDGKAHGNIDVAIAVEHLCLAATEQGLATCWVCNFDAAQCKQLFALDEQEEPVVLIPIGYAADEAKEKNRKAMSDILL